MSITQNKMLAAVPADGSVSNRIIPASGTTLPTVTLPTATSEDTAGLTQMNKHRA